MTGGDTAPDERQTVTISVRDGRRADEKAISISPVSEHAWSSGLFGIGVRTDATSATVYVDQYTVLHHDRERHTLSLHRAQGVRPGGAASTWRAPAEAVNAAKEILEDWLRDLGCEVKFAS